jgi:DNA-binding NarL/FixJ family response regulator
MENAPQHQTGLRVLLIGNAGAASAALAVWLAEQPGLMVCNRTGSAERVVAFAARFGPQVALLDFHGLAFDTAQLIAQLKELSPAPVVFVLTHDASPAMRRRCREAQADAVFDKTAELDALGAALTACRSKDGQLAT